MRLNNELRDRASLDFTIKTLQNRLNESNNTINYLNNEIQRFNVLIMEKADNSQMIRFKIKNQKIWRMF